MIAFERLYVREKCPRSRLACDASLGMNGGTPLEGRAKDIMEGCYSADDLKNMNLWYIAFDRRAHPLIDWKDCEEEIINNVGLGGDIRRVVVAHQDILDEQRLQKLSIQNAVVPNEEQKDIYVIVSIKTPQEGRRFFGFYKSDCPEGLFKEIVLCFNQGWCPPLRKHKRG